MKTSTRVISGVSLPVLALLAWLPASVLAGPTDISNEPLAHAASSTEPNIMFILDNSGSMSWEFSPDYASDDQVYYSDGTARTRAAYPVCFDSKDDDDVITTTPNNGTAGNAKLKTCALADPPFMSPQFNKQYYNPTITYRPALNHDGTERPSMNAANTANWTAVTTDGLGVQKRDQIAAMRNITTYGTDTVNLVTGYPDRIWCTRKNAAWGDLDDGVGTETGTPNAPLCVKNSGYEYPNHIYGYGENAGTTTVKYVSGGPYYYLMPVTEYCTTADLITCIDANADGSNPQPANYPYPSSMRWCSNSGTTVGVNNVFASCQGKRISGFIYPKAFGRVVSAAGAPAAQATAQLTFTAGADNQVLTIDSLTVDGVNLISPATSYSANNVVKSAGSTAINANDGTNNTNEQNSVAAAVTAAINDLTATTGFSATRVNNVVTIRAVNTGSWANGKQPVVGATIIPVTAATAQLTVEAVSRGSSVTALTANGIALIGGTVSCNYSNTSTNRTNCATNIRNAINAYTATSGFSATRSGAVVTITAPLAQGSLANGWQLVETGTVNTTADNPTKPVFAGGASNQLVNHSVTAFTGGAEAIPALAPTRVGVSAFSRVDIVSGQNYPRYATRTDCTASPGVCTYAEEMTNFANWYTYYRTRIMMMKTASGRAFASIPDSYRLGFITINPGSPVSSSKYLKIDNFVAGTGNQRDNWYTKLYAQSPSGGTPLREALSRVGWIFAGKFNTGLTQGIQAPDDPVQYSCQPNFAILSSDGYWNGNAGQQINGTALGDQDGFEDANWSKRADGVYDALHTTNALSDVALYYYKTDLRTDMTNNVRTSARDTAQHQHMTTFTLGLGLDGHLTYDRNYDTQNEVTGGDFWAIKRGDKNWPAAAANQPSALDDLWHAAVNGRGKFFSASNPAELSRGLSDTLAALEISIGAGAAAATSNLQPVAGDNFAFTAEYKTVEWAGDLKARTIDLSNGVVSSVVLWSAQTQLNNRVWSTRQIYTYDAADDAGNRLKSFCWPGSLDAVCADGAGLDATEQTYFLKNLLVQYPSLQTDQQSAITGQKMVDFIRGDRSNENTGGLGITDLFRNRTSVLGDIISAQPIYVKKAPFQYEDAYYADFIKCAGGYAGTCDAADFPLHPLPRRGTVYVASNGGMLHAFETDVNNDPYYQIAGISTLETSDDNFAGNNAGNGEERWAYIPGIVLPNLHKLADDPYAHRYFVDGSPVVGDICKGNCEAVTDWRSILVGGLNAGGRGYYALDVTNPQAPKALWEFKSTATCLTDAEANSGTYDADCHLGLSYGNPIITKRKVDHKWVVIVSSGLNNFTPGDGKGYLYILDAYTGKILRRISTGVGTSADPSGLGKINGWVNNSTLDNTTLAVYGGDMKGNLWKFELDHEKAAYNTAIKLAELKDNNGDPQPVTTKPELGLVSGYRAVMVGTGRYLGTDDPNDTSLQTIYAIRDDLSGVTVNARTETVSQTLAVDPTDDTKRTTTSNNAVDWGSAKGWRVDLPDTGERVNVDPILQLGTLVVASNVPHEDVCESGGYSYVNYLNFATGKGTSVKLSGALIVGINVVQLPGGVVKAIVTTADNQQITTDVPVTAASFSGRRVSWRELIQGQ